MSLDKNLFTLLVTPHKDDPNVIDLVDPAGTIHYRKQRVPGAVYTIQVYDFFSESLLVTATAPNATSKVKVLELYNPNMTVELKYTGTLSFRWSFKFEEHEFEWKREECYMIRKPDPPVLVAITKEPPGRLKTTSVQILDYNLNRFDIDDRKGLEIVILTALLTFHDANDVFHSPTGENGLLGVRRKSSATASPSPPAPTPPVLMTPPPPPPPRPDPKTGVDRIAEVHAVRGDVNEITVEEEGTMGDYAQYVLNLLQDDAMLFVSVRSAAAEQVPKVIQVVEETKRMRHRAGLAEESELHQYVVYDTLHNTANKGPRIINLDDDAGKGKKYAPPKSLTIHLSKIPLPELQPKPTNKTTPIATQPEPSKSKKDDKKVAAVSPASPVKQGKHNFLRRPRSTSPDGRVHAHQVHPHQPSPSPAQLNNPMIYSSPPPPPHHTRPSHKPSQSIPGNPPGNPGPAPSFPMPSLAVPVQPPPRPNSTGPSLYGSFAPPLYTTNLGQGSGQTSSKPMSAVTGFFDMLRR